MTLVRFPRLSLESRLRFELHGLREKVGDELGWDGERPSSEDMIRSMIVFLMSGFLDLSDELERFMRSLRRYELHDILESVL